MKENLKEFIRYLETTVINTLCNILIYYVLAFYNVSVPIANGIADISEVPISFYFKNKYVFKESNQKGIVKFIKFVESRIFSIIIEYVLVLILCMFINKYISKLIAQVLLLFINYFLSKFFVFKKI